MSSFNLKDADLQSMVGELDDKGWILIKNVYSNELLNEIKEELTSIIPIYEEIQEKAGILQATVNAYHHTVVSSPVQLKLIDPNPIADFLELYFNGKYILNNMGTSRILKNSGVYTQNIHRDIRSFIGTAKIQLNTLIMLDDSTIDNGATWMLEGSQRASEKPNEEFFYKNAIRVTGNKGDVLIFDGNIWHAAGENVTEHSRTIITPIYSKPFIKQGLDYPRALGYDFKDRIGVDLAQLLGYNALTPSNLREFYQPNDQRFYKMDQG